MRKALLIKLTGIIGILLVLVGYYLFWISPDAEMSEVIRRTRYAIVLNLSGGLMVVFYFYKRQS